MVSSQGDRLHFRPMQPIHVPLLSQRQERVQLLQKINHVIPAVGLVTAGAHALAEGARGGDLVLAVVEVGTTILLAASIVQTLRARRQPAAHHDKAHAIDWIDVWAAGVLFAEAAERWHVKHHIARPTMLTALVTLAFGLFHGRILAYGRRRRGLRITSDGVSVAGRPFRGFRARWPEIASITLSERFAEIRARTGRVRRIDLGDLHNADSVRAALEEARRQWLLIQSTKRAANPGVPIS
jgi:hypothetical protein